MPEPPTTPPQITAETLTKQLAELSRLRDEFEQTKQTCVGGDDPVTEAEFEAWLKSFGELGDYEQANFPRYRRCMEAYEELGYKCNEIELLPMMSRHPAVTELAQLFPSLRDAPGVEPFDEFRFEEWTKTEATSMAKHAAKFVLSVWEDMPQSFNLTEAFRDWDDEHREAYIAWFNRPLMPRREMWGKF
jgi:hypothetical protein